MSAIDAGGCRRRGIAPRDALCPVEPKANQTGKRPQIRRKAHEAGALAAIDWVSEGLTLPQSHRRTPGGRSSACVPTPSVADAEERKLPIFVGVSLAGYDQLAIWRTMHLDLGCSASRDDLRVGDAPCTSMSHGRHSASQARVVPRSLSYTRGAPFVRLHHARICPSDSHRAIPSADPATARPREADLGLPAVRADEEAHVRVSANAAV